MTDPELGCRGGLVIHWSSYPSIHPCPRMLCVPRLLFDCFLNLYAPTDPIWIKPALCHPALSGGGWSFCQLGVSLLEQLLPHPLTHPKWRMLLLFALLLSVIPPTPPPFSTKTQIMFLRASYFFLPWSAGLTLVACDLWLICELCGFDLIWFVFLCCFNFCEYCGIADERTPTPSENCLWKGMVLTEERVPV